MGVFLYRFLAIAAVLVGWVASGPLAVAGQPVPPPSRIESAQGTSGVRYLALGDSLTIGEGSPVTSSFPARLADRWRATGCAVTLENVGVSGNTTEDLINFQLPVIASFRPTFVTVLIGPNDIVAYLPLDEYRQNVRRILDAANASGARVVVLPQPDWPRSPTGANYGTLEELMPFVVSFNAALAAETRAKGAEWVDLVPLMQQQAARGQWAEDQLHPSAEAYDAWAAELARVLASPCA